MRVAGSPLLWNFLGSLSVVLAVGGLAFGLPAIDRLIPAQRPVDSGQAFLVGGGVTVRPPEGAALDLTRTRRGADRGSAMFVLDTVRYAIVVAPFVGSLPAAAARLRARITDSHGYQVTGTESPVTTAGGLVGLQGGYTAPGRGGRYAVFLVGGLAIEVTVSGAAG
ncbi:MAG TPA: hypothetical protein VF755_23930, partial [Catenuloplanes sp.]